MYPAPFQYVRPRTLDEALKFLADHGDDAKLLAGGQSLIPLLKLRLAFPRFVVDIARLAELRGIREKSGALEIGCLVRHVEVERSELVCRALPLLSETAAEIGDVQVRNRGTIGGSLAHADAAADFPAAALALDAHMVMRSSNGERVVAAQEFFVDLMTTALAPAEMLTAIRFPAPPARCGAAYVKLRQQASGFAIAGAAAGVALDKAGNIAHVRVAITGVNGIPYRAVKLEQQLAGLKPTADAIAAASAHAADGISPLADLHGSAEYRREMGCVVARRALLKSIERIGG
jgi:carbon-monoxide dehydrogenase medium subunit